MVLSGLGRVQRGAEAAFLELARQWHRQGLHVEQFGSGDRGVEDVPLHILPCRPRERFEKWPALPTLHSEAQYEELLFARNLARDRRFQVDQFDVVVTCTFPWINWLMRWRCRGAGRPLHVYVTQNGDWPCQQRDRLSRTFRCDGLVCTNPEYYERNHERHPTVLIPNGVDPDIFRPHRQDEPRAVPDLLPETTLPPDARVVLIASAQIPSKRVADGVRAAARVPGAFLAIAGDGPERAEIARLATELLPGRHALLGSVPRDRMPALFRRADAFLHMSQDEPSALVYLEAASTGLPLVVHDSRVTRWTLDDAAAYVDTSDLEAVAATLQPVLAAAGPGSELGARARQRVLDGWSWEVLARRYRAFFDEQRAARSGAPRP
jgi:glycosyltransferase involved in cell wall biosynthesis